jgi:hypothetical protein
MANFRLAVTNLCLEVRELCLSGLLKLNKNIGGLDSYGVPKVVEIDVSVFFKRKKNRV